MLVFLKLGCKQYGLLLSPHLTYRVHPSRLLIKLTISLSFCFLQSHRQIMLRVNKYPEKIMRAKRRTELKTGKIEMGKISNVEKN